MTADQGSRVCEIDARIASLDDAIAATANGTIVNITHLRALKTDRERQLRRLREVAVDAAKAVLS